MINFYPIDQFSPIELISKHQINFNSGFSILNFKLNPSEIFVILCIIFLNLLFILNPFQRNALPYVTDIQILLLSILVFHIRACVYMSVFVYGRKHFNIITLKEECSYHTCDSHTTGDSVL